MKDIYKLTHDTTYGIYTELIKAVTVVTHPPQRGQASSYLSNTWMVTVQPPSYMLSGGYQLMQI